MRPDDRAEEVVPADFRRGRGGINPEHRAGDERRATSAFSGRHHRAGRLVWRPFARPSAGDCTPILTPRCAPDGGDYVASVMTRRGGVLPGGLAGA